MKKFKINYTSLVITLICVCIAIFVAGLVFAIVRLVDVYKLDKINAVIYVIIIALDLVLLTFTISLLFFSKYCLTADKLILSFGFIKVIYEINEIIEINHFKKTDKLVVYFNNQKYTVILISSKNYDEFIKSVRQINRAILFDEKIENQEDNK